MQVQDYMQTHVITIAPEERVSAAFQRMRGHNIRHLPVVTATNCLVGIITDRDVRQAGASDEPEMAEHELLDLLEPMTVTAVMTQPVVTVQRDTSVLEAGRLFLTHKFGCLPVVRADQTLVGILTVTDLLQAYVARHAATP